LEGESASTLAAGLLPKPAGRIRGIAVRPFRDFFNPIQIPQPGLNPACARRRSNAMAATSFTPLHDRILVRRLEEGEIKLSSGIIIPDSAKEKPQEGEVIAVGKGKSNDEGKVFPLDVKAGDKILFGKYSGTEIKLDGVEFLIMREEEVLGIVTK
jgi:chaperonin GroES